MGGSPRRTADCPCPASAHGGACCTRDPASRRIPPLLLLLCRWVPVRERSRSLSLVYSGMYTGSMLGLALSPQVMGLARHALWELAPLPTGTGTQRGR